MLILKLTAIGFTAAVSLLQVGLDYRWRDKRTRAHKRVRWIMIAAIFSSGIAAAALVVYDDRQMFDQVNILKDLKSDADKARTAAEAREESAQRHRDEVKSKLDSLETAIKPIVQVATSRYPQLESSAALARLADEVQALQQRSQMLEKQTRELASRDTFRALSEPIREAVQRELRVSLADAQSGLLSVEVGVDTGHPGRHRVAAELVEILKGAGLTTKGPTSGMTFSKATLPAVTIQINPADESLARAIASALHPFLQVNFVGKKKDKLERGHVSIHLSGEPVFAEDGSVTFQ